MFKSLKSWLTASRPTASTPAPRRFAPQVEALHNRITPTVSVSGNNLNIYGTPYVDTVTVDIWTSKSGSYFKITEDSNLYLSQPTTTYIPVGYVSGIVTFQGYDGNDSFTNNTTRGSFAAGGNGNDTLVGGYGQDDFQGGAGNDWMDGKYGSDILSGGDGDDVIFAGGLDPSGNTLSGGNGNDSLYGSNGDDQIRGGAGNDWMHGSGGKDSLYGEAGRDTLIGGAGNDRLDGGVGDGESDVLWGYDGADVFVIDFAVGWSAGGYTYNRDAAQDFNSTDDQYASS